MTQPTTTKTITTVSGKTKPLPAHVEAAGVVGLDYRGRIVVDWSGALNAPPNLTGNFSDEVSVSALTMCCNATDKGSDDATVCRGCYEEIELADHYIYRDADGSWSQIDRVASIA